MLSDSSKQVAIAESQRLRDLGYYTHAVNNLKDLLTESNGADLEITIILADILTSQGYWQEAREVHASFFKRSEDVRTTAGHWIYPAQLMYCLFDTVCSGEQEHALSAAASIYTEFEKLDGLSHSVPDISVLTVTFYGTLLHLAHNFGISGKSEQATLNSLLETRIKPDFSILLSHRQYRNALRLATAYRMFSNRPDNLCLLQELRNHLDTPELVKALATFEIAKDLEQLGSYAQCDAIYVVEVSPILDRLGHSHAATDISLSQKCRVNAKGKEADIWDLLLEYRAFDYPTGLFESLKKALRNAERTNNIAQRDSIWALGKNLVSHAQWSLASWELSSLYLAQLSRHDASADACLNEGFKLYKSLQTTSLEALKATLASILGNEYLVRMDGENAVKWGQLCETSMSKCSSRPYPDATLIILQGRFLQSSQHDDLKDIIIWVRTAIETDIENGYPEKASAKCQALLSYIVQRSPMPSAESILITQEFHVKNEALKNRIQAQQPQPAAELWEAAISLIREGKERRDLGREEAALELLQKHHRIALHTGNISLVADNERRTGILYCDMFEKELCNGGQPQKWLIDRAFELLFSANGSYVHRADLENQKECAFWLAKISFEKSLHDWSGEPEVLDRCRIAEDIYHKRRLEVESHGGGDTLEDRSLLVEIYRFAIQTCEASGDQERAAAWREKYRLAVA